jgi:hypothetical protein
MTRHATDYSNNKKGEHMLSSLRWHTRAPFILGEITLRAHFRFSEEEKNELPTEPTNQLASEFEPWIQISTKIGQFLQKPNKPVWTGSSVHRKQVSYNSKKNQILWNFEKS